MQYGSGVLWRQFFWFWDKTVTSKGPSGGYADIYIDKVIAKTNVDFYAKIEESQQLIFVSPKLKEGRHTIKIIVKGTKNPLSNNTYVYMDAFEYINTELISGSNLIKDKPQLPLKKDWEIKLFFEILSE